MKHTKSILCQLFVVALSVTVISAKPSIFNPFPASSSSIIGDLLSNIGGAAGNIIAAIENATQTGSAAAGDIAEIVRNATDGLLEQAANLGKQLEAHTSAVIKRNVNDFLSTLERLRTELDARGKNIKNRAEYALIKQLSIWLENVSSQADDLEQRIEEAKQSWNDNIAEQSSELLSEWNIWASNQLDKVYQQTDGAENVLDAAENIINDFINTYSILINNCAEGVASDLDKYQIDASNVLDKYQSQIDLLIGDLQECIQDNGSSELTADCKTNIQERIFDLRDAPSDLTKLIRRGLKLRKPNFIRTTCVRQTLADFSLQRLRIQKQINELINSNNENTEDAADSIESGLSSESNDEDSTESDENGENSAISDEESESSESGESSESSESGESSDDESDSSDSSDSD